MALLRQKTRPKEPTITLIVQLPNSSLIKCFVIIHDTANFNAVNLSRHDKTSKKVIHVDEELNPMSGITIA